MEQTERIITPLSPELLKLVEDIRFKHRHPSRAESVRRLIEAGAEAIDPEAFAAYLRAVEARR